MVQCLYLYGKMAYVSNSLIRWSKISIFLIRWSKISNSLIRWSKISIFLIRWSKAFTSMVRWSKVYSSPIWWYRNVSLSGFDFLAFLSLQSWKMLGNKRIPRNGDNTLLLGIIPMGLNCWNPTVATFIHHTWNTITWPSTNTVSGIKPATLGIHMLLSQFHGGDCGDPTEITE